MAYFTFNREGGITNPLLGITTISYTAVAADGTAPARVQFSGVDGASSLASGIQAAIYFQELIQPTWDYSKSILVTNTLRFSRVNESATTVTTEIPRGTQISTPNNTTEHVDFVFESEAVRTAVFGATAPGSATGQTMQLTGIGLHVATAAADANRGRPAILCFNGSDGVVNMQWREVYTSGAGTDSFGVRATIGEPRGRNDALAGGAAGPVNGIIKIGPRESFVVDVHASSTIDDGTYFYVDAASTFTNHKTVAQEGERLYFLNTAGTGNPYTV